MASLVNYVKCGVINKTYTSTMGYYVINFVLEAYTLQDDTTCDGKKISAGELFVKAHYLSCIKQNTNFYWFPTRTIVHPCLDVVAVKDVHDTNKSIRNRNHTKQALQKHYLCLTESDHDYILEEIEHRDKIESVINLRDHGDEE